MSLTPLLRCKNTDETRDFYRALPGFSASGPEAAVLTVDGHEGRLIFTADDLWQATPVCTGTFYFTVADVDALFSRLPASVTVSWPLQDMPYGSREFGIVDCNGYLLAFQQAGAH